MNLGKNKYRILLLIVSTLIIFMGCQKDEEMDELIDGEDDIEEVIFEFPKINYVDSLIYLEIKKTCKNHWNLSTMEESTFVILSYKDEYSIHCVGQKGNQYYWFIIKTDLDGNFKSESIKDYSGRGTYFDIKNIEQLKLDTLRIFWIETPKIDTSATIGKVFQGHPELLGNLLKSDKNGNSIGISVFKTKEAAVEAMEMRISTTSCRINVGNSDVLPGFWWYAECGGYNAVFVNRWNIVLEISQNNPEFKAVEKNLYTTANEIVRRVGLLLN